MILIDTVYSIVRNLLRKNQQGYIAPSEFNRYAVMANYARFNELYGAPESMRMGVPVRMAYAEAKQIDEKLSVFLVTASLTPNSNGVLTRPTDMLRMDSIKSTTNGKISKVKRLNKNQEAIMAGSVAFPPTIEYPFYVDYGSFYKFYPATIGAVDAAYLATPGTVFWNHTNDGQGRPVYSASGTTNFKWEESEIGNIVAKILEYAGKSVGDNTAIQLAAQLEMKGQ